MEESVIKIQNAGIKLGKFIMKPVNLEIPRGYIVGIQGDNGAGKSTLIRMILGKYMNMQGHIYVNDCDAVTQRCSALQKVGFISQDHSLFMGENAIENEKKYAPFYTDWDSEVYHMWMNEMELSMSKNLKAFSTGEYIKYQLAFAAAYRPDVLLLDEPTANLDTVFRDDFLRILQKFVADYDMTILIATHLQEDLSRIADYVIDIENGQCKMREAQI